MDRQTAMEIIAAIGRGEMTAEEAPDALWTWLASHVSFTPTSTGLNPRIED